MATAAVLTAGTVAACGASSGHWLSAAQANRLSADLNSVSTALDSGACAQAQRYLTRFQNDLSSLGNVNSTLVANLNQGVSTVESLATSTCHVRAKPTPTRSRPKPKTHTSTNATPTTTAPAFTNTVSQPPTPTTGQPTTSVATTSTTGGASPVTPTATNTTPVTTTPGGGGATTTPYTGPGTSGGG